MRTLVIWFALLNCTSLAAARPHPLEDYFRLPAYGSPTLSPDGRYFAALVPVKGHMSLAVIDFETRTSKGLASFDDFDVIDLHWVGNERLVFSLGQITSPTGPEHFDGGGLFAVRRDASEFRKLSPTVRELRQTLTLVYRGLSYVRSVPGSDEEIIARARERNVHATDLYRVNVRTGQKTLLTFDRPERVTDWVMDEKLVPRIAIANTPDTTQYVVYVRGADGKSWQPAWTNDVTQGPVRVPLSWDSDAHSVLVASNEGRATMGVYRYDAATMKPIELLAQHPRFDMAADASGAGAPGPMLDPDSGKLVGFAVEAERPQFAWVDTARAQIQKAIDQALPGTVNLVDASSSGTRLLVTSISDAAPVHWSLFDRRKNTLEDLFSSRPWFEPGDLVEMKPFYLKTRDGLEILSYYLLPKDRKPGEKLPTVIDVHGGPMVRADLWGRFTWDVREAQLLASRGYAVVLPNFRITPGLGSKIYYSGFGTVGRQMSDDHEDAAAWAINEGIADPQRICIIGGSYGGYATLRALAKSPSLFKCGVAMSSVTDFERQLYSPLGDTSSSPEGVAYWKKVLGFDPKSKEENRAISPAFQADRIGVPVYLAVGTDDIRTPMEQTLAMQRALAEAGKPVTLLVKPLEGHGFGKLENLVELYTGILKFLEQNIGVR